MDDIRIQRVSEQLRSEIARLILQGDVKDPRVGSFVSVTRVEVARDASHAKVFISLISLSSDDAKISEEEKLEAAVAGLNHAAGFIQRELGRVLTMRLTPKLTFIADHGIKEGFLMNEKIRDLIEKT